jgi:hypothetical protein
MGSTGRVNIAGDGSGNAVWEIRVSEGFSPVTAWTWHIEGVGPIVMAYMHSYDVVFRGGSENKEDIEGRGRVTSGVVCNVRVQVEVENVAKECPEDMCEYG